MSDIKAFNGLLPKADNVEKVSAVPYDVVNTEEAAELAKGNPLSFLRVSRPEIEMPSGTDIHGEKVYAKATENFQRLKKSAPLLTDEEKHLYVYSLEWQDRVQTGIIGAASVDDYDSGIIKKHEKTRVAKEDDRTKHLMALRSHTGPVFLSYRDSGEINRKVAEIIEKTSPWCSFTANDGVKHTLWRMSSDESAETEKLFESVPYLYIADGHHRAASASRAAAICRKENPEHTGEEDYNYFMTVSFPMSHLQILPYNRAVKDLNGLNQNDFISAISAKFAVSETDLSNPRQHGHICMYMNSRWYLLEPKFDIDSLGVKASLDVRILQDNILQPLLGINDPRTSDRIDFIGGIRGTSELEKLVENKKAAVAFSMYPTSMKELLAIADANEIMPPKSTWFEPKLRDGLVCHNF